MFNNNVCLKHPMREVEADFLFFISLVIQVT